MNGPDFKLGHYSIFPKPQNRSDLGVQVKITIVIEIYVRWSVKFPITALASLVSNVLSVVRQMKEVVMSNLHAMVLVGVALLSVPGRIDESQFG